MGTEIVKTLLGAAKEMGELCQTQQGNAEHFSKAAEHLTQAAVNALQVERHLENAQYEIVKTLLGAAKEMGELCQTQQGNAEHFSKAAEHLTQAAINALQVERHLENAQFLKSGA